MRKLFSNTFIFKVSKIELKTIFEEIIEPNNELISDISNFSYSKPYEFLLIMQKVIYISKNLMKFCIIILKSNLKK